MGGPGRGNISATMPVHEKEQLEGPRERGHSPMPLKIRCRERDDPPPLTQEDEGMVSPHDTTPPSSERGQMRMTLECWTSPTMGTNGPDVSMGESSDSTQYYLAMTSSLQSTNSSRWEDSDDEDIHNNKFKGILDLDGGEPLINSSPINQQTLQDLAAEMLQELTAERLSENSTRTGSKEAIGFTNLRNLLVEKHLSKAMQQKVLLRRCFFPRRDVIRWGLLQEKMGCPGGRSFR